MGHELANLKRNVYQKAVASASKFADDLHQVYTAVTNIAAAKNNRNAPSMDKKYGSIGDCAPALFRLGCSSIRGLETLAYPRRKSDRQTTIRSVIAAQRQCTNKMENFQKAEYLAAVSCFHSQRSKVFAKVMAKADATVASRLSHEGTRDMFL